MEKLIFRIFLNIEMRVNLLENKDEFQIRNEERLHELFDVQLRPLRSKNARTIYLIIVDMKNIPFLTTFDLQNKLKQMNIDLSKKEINGLLRSLQEASLITKEAERGKPSTTIYDDKYTFDKWYITPKGEEISKIVNSLIAGKIEPIISPSIETIEEIAVQNKITKKQIRDNIEQIYLYLTTLKGLHRKDGLISRDEIHDSLIPEEAACDRAVSSFLDKGLIEAVEPPRTSGLRLWLYRMLGLSMGDDASFRLTKKGRSLADKLWSQN
jgi:DNA-binding HxlR family transcriptional regulator